MKTKEFNEFFNTLDKKEFENFWRSHFLTEIAEKYNLRDYREAKKVVDKLGLTRTLEEENNLKLEYNKRCSRPGSKNGMFGKSAVKGRQHTDEEKEKISKGHKNLITINLDNQEKRVSSDQLDLYLNNGWLLGESASHINNKKSMTILGNLKRYGVENPFYLDSVKLKIKETNLKKYGVENPSLSPEISKKKQETLFNKYGRYHICNKYEYDSYKFDSSWELLYYIYLKENNTEFEYQPKSNFIYYINDTPHYYCPDFKVGNEYIEIKGDQFFKPDGTMYNPYSKDQIKTIKKYECMISNNVKILRWSDLKEIFSGLEEKYGKNFIKQYKI